MRRVKAGANGERVTETVQLESRYQVNSTVSTAPMTERSDANFRERTCRH